MGRNPDMCTSSSRECALSHGPPPELVRSHERAAARRHIRGFFAM
jgi:hypothetical protein